ncbi:MAG: hypothetical protein IT556_05235 [Acetobacteraceae bacterium]|nr:hypothetical protein [Acetobacteraceae bacterium]
MSFAATWRARRLGIALALLLPAVLLGGLLKGSLIAHLLVQFPALVIAGVLLGASTARREARAGAPTTASAATTEGVAAILLAGFCLAFWMLPRWVDAAVLDPWADGAKIASLVLLAGVPLGWGWRRVGPLARAVVWANATSMLLVMGMLYVTFPQRLCNTYLVDQQVALGWAVLTLALALAASGAIRALAGEAIAGAFSPRRGAARSVPRGPLQATR